MKARIWSCTATVSLVILGSAFVLNAQAPKDPKVSEEKTKPDSTAEPVTVEEARERAKLMHNIYAKTLLVVHHHYFRREGSVLPARALEDVFAGIDEQSNIKARWIAVNTPPMSINHKPEGEFEEKAAAQIAEGKAAYERVEGGYYKRAGMIPLGVGCVGCHTKLFQTQAKTPRFAGLVISIPVKEKK
jgi:hypothetical protein